MSLRAVLFVDYENTMLGARRAFHDGEAGLDESNGHVHPRHLGLAICQRHNERYATEDPLDLTGVRVYRGLPDSRREPRRNTSVRSQSRGWEESGVEVFLQPFGYDDHTRTRQEKEIDVWLAIDMVVLAIEDQYDVAILFSQDRDFRPALRYVRDSTSARADVAGWRMPQRGSFLDLEGQGLRRHFVSENDYHAVADQTDYRRKPRHNRKRPR